VNGLQYYCLELPSWNRDCFTETKSVNTQDRTFYDISIIHRNYGLLWTRLWWL